MMDANLFPSTSARANSRGFVVPLGSLRGVPLRLSAAWLPLAALVTYVYGSRVLSGWLGVPPAVGYVIGLVFTVGLVGSVLVHEIGHALTGGWLGVRARGITVEALGGYTELEAEPSQPRAELLISLAGPAASLGLGLGCALVSALLPAGTLAEEMVGDLAWANLLVAGFNALPGLPLDGGRVLQAVVWAAGGDRIQGTRVAGWCGRGLAALILASSVMAFVSGILSVTGVVVGALMTASIWTGASQAMGMAELTELLAEMDAERLARPIVAVPRGASLERAAWLVTRCGLPDPEVVVADDDERRIIGIVNPTAAAAVPRDRARWVSVDAVARHVGPQHVVGVDTRGMDLVNAVGEDPRGQYLVVRGEDVIGVLRGADVTTLLESKGLVSRRTTR